MRCEGNRLKCRFYCRYLTVGVSPFDLKGILLLSLLCLSFFFPVIFHRKN